MKLVFCVWANFVCVLLSPRVHIFARVLLKTSIHTSLQHYVSALRCLDKNRIATINLLYLYRLLKIVSSPFIDCYAFFVQQLLYKK